MTVRQVISLLRSRVKEYSDDTLYTDEMLYDTLVSVRALLLHREQNKRSNEVFTNPFFRQAFCLELEKGLSHDCDCVKHGCTVLKSKYKLPTALAGMVVVRTLGGNTIDIVDINRQKFISRHPMFSLKPTASIVNNKLIIWNNLLYKAVVVEAIWEDPTDWIGIQLCDGENGPSDCYDDPLDMDFGITASYTTQLIQMALESVLQSYKIQSDLNNDSNPDIRQ